jgi:hypothetical protein
MDTKKSFSSIMGRLKNGGISSVATNLHSAKVLIEFAKAAAEGGGKLTVNDRWRNLSPVDVGDIIEAANGHVSILGPDRQMVFGANG